MVKNLGTLKYLSAFSVIQNQAAHSFSQTLAVGR